MGNFDDHVQYGYRAHAIYAVALVIYGVLAGFNSDILVGLPAIVFPFVFAGAVFPDIDHHASKPHRAFMFTAVCLAFVGTISGMYSGYFGLAEQVARHAPFTVPLRVSVAVVIIGCAVFVAVSTAYILSHFRPSHRGVTHRPFFGFLASVGVGVLVWNSIPIVMPGVPRTVVSAICSVGFGVGVVSHLFCDGLHPIPTRTEVLRVVRERLSR